MVAYTIAAKWWWKKLLEEIKWELISAHPETTSCHSEPFDGLPETTLGTGRTGSAKNLCGRVTMRFFVVRRRQDSSE
jgi:hypothetical protein